MNQGTTRAIRTWAVGNFTLGLSPDFGGDRVIALNDGKSARVFSIGSSKFLAELRHSDIVSCLGPRAIRSIPPDTASVPRGSSPRTHRRRSRLRFEATTDGRIAAEKLNPFSAGPLRMLRFGSAGNKASGHWAWALGRSGWNARGPRHGKVAYDVPMLWLLAAFLGQAKSPVVGVLRTSSTGPGFPGAEVDRSKPDVFNEALAALKSKGIASYMGPS